MGTHYGGTSSFVPPQALAASFAAAPQPAMRRYEVRGMTPDGTPQDFARAMPADPHVDEAFCAFAHGTLIATPQGPVAVEDLAPGMTVETAGAGPQPLLWVGSTVLAPPTDRRGEIPVLTRITADSLGLGRPMPDLVLGPRARMLVRHPGCRALTGAEAAFAPATGFVDGMALIALRVVRPTRVFHLALSGQQVLLANGVEVESYHPGENASLLIDNGNRMRFLSLFPHVSGFSGFGAMPVPRLNAFELDGLNAA
ncbi:Hint domain-containing protein [Rhodovulum visakhapatnamense]|uniref:Hint domain-containing protein n=1 Tax=Rhodovulum visakhapatnamense TaxID=364297 RepID=A0ABS1RJE5_9RHOB|nr:Hint domain-containing protein [Rhodovulum visakhapatnamense]MBL3570255.1 Hint domain-containing protein [Rhodovulum visakhapatnamense]MBL3579027.1 Hint domain-containing protein [Rhodovulum visakhapatnamense]